VSSYLGKTSRHAYLLRSPDKAIELHVLHFLLVIAILLYVTTISYSMPSIILAQRIKDVLGILSLLATSRDVYLLLLTWFICMCAYSSSTLVLALYFAALGHSDTKIGLFLSLMLVGDVGVSLLLTLVQRWAQYEQYCNIIVLFNMLYNPTILYESAIQQYSSLQYIEYYNIHLCQVT
jgi:hypothetical protein